MKLKRLNNEMLNELNMQDVKDGVKKVVDGTKETIKGAKKVIVDETKDNINAFKIFIRKIKRQPVTQEEFKSALNQLFKDNTKLITIAGIGALPGSAVTLPIAIKVAKKFGVNLIPSKTFK